MLVDNAHMQQSGLSTMNPSNPAPVQPDFDSRDQRIVEEIQRVAADARSRRADASPQPRQASVPRTLKAALPPPQPRDRRVTLSNRPNPFPVHVDAFQVRSVPRDRAVDHERHRNGLLNGRSGHTGNDRRSASYSCPSSLL